MITFRQKNYSEYDAMRSLYLELTKYGNKNKVDIIDKSSLIPVLKGNNVVIERFVISTNFFGKDKYRMYLKIGSKAKMPDDVRLPGYSYDRKIGNMSVSLNTPGSGGNPNQNNQNSGNYNNTSNPTQSSFSSSDEVTKTFGKGGGGGGPKPVVTGSINSSYELKQSVQKLTGETLVYDKNTRSLVLEFSSLQDAVNALNILPFGIEYKLYLLS